MNPKIVAAIYGTAFTSAIILSAIRACCLKKQQEKNPIPQAKLVDTGDGERKINPKFIKVICKE